MEWNFKVAAEEPITSEEDAADIEQDVDRAIEIFAGDMRATIRALILANAFLERELANTVSAGFVRRKKLQA